MERVAESRDDFLSTKGKFKLSLGGSEIIIKDTNLSNLATNIKIEAGPDMIPRVVIELNICDLYVETDDLSCKLTIKDMPDGIGRAILRQLKEKYNHETDTR